MKYTASIKLVLPAILWGAASICQAQQAAPTLIEDIIKDVATCNVDSIDKYQDYSNQSYEFAQKSGTKSDVGEPFMEVYKLKTPIELAPNFSSQDIVFVGGGVGVMVEGERSAELAKIYTLSDNPIPNTLYSGKWFAKIALAQTADHPELVLLAQEVPGLDNKTFLTCGIFE